MNTNELTQKVIEALEDHKAQQITLIDVTSLTPITDCLIICSATSKRHANTLAEKVVTQSKNLGTHPFGVEGFEDSEWILIDLHDVIVHIMLPSVREFYNLEKLWQPPVESAAGSHSI